MSRKESGLFFITTNIESFFTKHSLSGRRLTYEFPLCGVDDARTIGSQIFSLSAHETYIVVLLISAITEEAQNTLLKVTEELPAHVSLVLQIFEPRTLLPTFLSRAYEISDYEQISEVSKELYTKILFSDYASRLEFLDELLGKSREDNTHIVRERAKQFLDFLMKEFFSKKEYTILKEYVEIKSLIGHEVAPIKSLLEYVLLITPYTKPS